MLVAFFLLAAAGLLEVAELAFPGLDRLVGLGLLSSMVLGAIGALRGPNASSWGLIAIGLAALLLGRHVCLILGVLS